MPPRASSPKFPGHVVTAVVVTHDGARWLSDCLGALAAQTRPAQRTVVVDTGSLDGSGDAAAAALGAAAVLRLPRDTGLGAAVQAGIDAFAGSPDDAATGGDRTQWVWVLHDDCAPAPDALLRLLGEAEGSPSVAAFAPKLVTWDGAHLAEVGRPVDSSGHVRTGIERREVDQGQHDETGDVLAASTAGLLVRRTVWDQLGGLDSAWPLFGDDVDFGWRVNAAGERLRLAPGSVVRHVAALEHGQRAADAVSGRAAAVARRHAVQVVLADTSPWLVPVLAVRYVVESLLRSVAHLLLDHRVGAARDELTGVLGALARPGVVVAARRRRRGRTVPHRDLRSLLAPPSLRWRRWGDALAATFAGHAAADERRRRRAPVETGPVAAEAESLDLGDTGALARFVRRPGVVLVVVLTVVGLVGSRHFLGGGLHGGRLLPPPGGSTDLWSTYVAAWHPVQLGSTTAAPPYLAVLALLSTLLLGKAWLAVAVLMIGAVPLAGLSAYVASGAVSRSPALRVWAAAVYALLPAVTGAVAAGRVDVVTALVLLPLAVRAAVAAVRSGATTGAVAAGVVLAAAVACAPLLWPVAAVTAIGGIAVARHELLRRAAAAALLLVVPLATLLPWTLRVLTHPRLLVRGGGLPEQYAAHRPLGPADLLLLHPGGPGTPPAWLLAPLLAAAVVGLARRRGAVAARFGFLVLVVGVVAALVVSRVAGAAGTDPAVRYWSGVPLAVAAVGALIAAVVAGDRARPALRQRSFGWRQLAAVGLLGALVVGTLGIAVDWVARAPRGPISAGGTSVLPVFAAADVTLATSPRVLVLRSRGGVVRYSLLRRAGGPRLGDGDVAAPTAADRRLETAVRAVTAGQASAVQSLVGLGIGMLVVPRPDEPALHRLADVDGLSQVPTTSAVIYRTADNVGELVVVDAAAAARARAGRDLPPGAARRPLPAADGHAGTIVRPGAPGRLLVLAEPADRHWRARLNGRALPRATAYGWAQAWQLPASGGALTVDRTGGGRRWWLLLELVFTVACVLYALPGGRRSGADDDPAPVPAAPVPGPPDPVVAMDMAEPGGAP